jgi:hypothetical protein
MPANMDKMLVMQIPFGESFTPWQNNSLVQVIQQSHQWSLLQNEYVKQLTKKLESLVQMSVISLKMETILAMT